MKKILTGALILAFAVSVLIAKVTYSQTRPAWVATAKAAATSITASTATLITKTKAGDVAGVRAALNDIAVAVTDVRATLPK